MTCICAPASTVSTLRRLTILALLLLGASEAALACTLFAAHGSRVAGGGTLIVKVRDWTPGDRQVLERVTPPLGYVYYALVTEGEDPGVKAGINERGLVVESATASSIPKPERQEPGYTKGLLRKLLAKCATVDEVVAKSALFRGPRFLLVADATKVACIEVGPRGRVRVEVTRDGVTAHTNHYLAGALTGANQKDPGASSLSRFNRIQELLESKAPHTLDGFLAFSRDRHAGPDLSIFRTGLKPTGTRTMSVWAVRLKPGGGADIIVRLLNAGEPEQTLHRDFADLFGKASVK
jgi:hypothetical protein